MWKKDFLFHLKSPKSFFHIKEKSWRKISYFAWSLQNLSSTLKGENELKKTFCSPWSLQNLSSTSKRKNELNKDFLFLLKPAKSFFHIKTARLLPGCFSVWALRPSRVRKDAVRRRRAWPYDVIMRTAVPRTIIYSIIKFPFRLNVLSSLSSFQLLC